MLGSRIVLVLQFPSYLLAISRFLPFGQGLSAPLLSCFLHSGYFIGCSVWQIQASECFVEVLCAVDEPE